MNTIDSFVLAECILKYNWWNTSNYCCQGMDSISVAVSFVIVETWDAGFTSILAAARSTLPNLLQKTAGLQERTIICLSYSIRIMREKPCDEREFRCILNCHLIVSHCPFCLLSTFCFLILYFCRKGKEGTLAFHLHIRFIFCKVRDISKGKEHGWSLKAK